MTGIISGLGWVGASLSEGMGIDEGMLMRSRLLLGEAALA